MGNRATHAAALTNPHSARLRPARLPAIAQWAMLVLFIGGLATAGLWALSDHWRRATLALGVSMLWLSIMRPLCDDRIIGWFSVRSRQFDMLFTFCLGAAMTFLAVTVESLGS